jgi:predicted Zn-dependent protease
LYGTANSEKGIEKKKTTRAKKETKGKSTSTPNKESDNTGGVAATKANTAWMITSNAGTKSKGTPAETPKQTPKILGANKYKLATAAQDQRMDKIEEAVKAIAIARKNQKEDPRIASLDQHIASIAQLQNEANEALKKKKSLFTRNLLQQLYAPPSVLLEEQW